MEFPHQEQLEFTHEEVEKLRARIEKEKLTFFFVPNSQLKELTMQDTHPLVKKLPTNFKTGILLGNTITLKREIVFNYLKKKLEQPWSFLLAYGEIRVKGDDLFAFKTKAYK